jgi:hypothetical protein
MMAWELA